MDCEARGAGKAFELRDVYTLHGVREKLKSLSNAHTIIILYDTPCSLS